MNVRDQFAYYSLQCLCPNQVSNAGGVAPGVGAGRRRAPDQLLLAEAPCLTPFCKWPPPESGKDTVCP